MLRGYIGAGRVRNSEADSNVHFSPKHAYTGTFTVLAHILIQDIWTRFIEKRINKLSKTYCKSEDRFMNIFIHKIEAAFLLL